MDDKQLNRLLTKAQNGDKQSREKILSHFKSYVLNVASRVSKRYLTWSDDETSVGFFALNKAIDLFNHKLGKSFLNFSYMLISQEIIDFFRKESRHQNLSLHDIRSGDEETAAEASMYEREAAEREHELREEQGDLIQEILMYQAELEKYGLSFDELPDHSPKHRDTRANCFYLARRMMEDQGLVKHLQQKKRLPVTALSRLTGTSTKTIEKHRRYIMAVVVLLLHPDLDLLKTYIEKGGD